MGGEFDAIAVFQTPIETEVRTEVTPLSSLENKNIYLSDPISIVVKQLTTVFEEGKSQIREVSECVKNILFKSTQDQGLMETEPV